MAEKGGDEESLLGNYTVPSRASSSYTIEPGRETLAGSRSSSSESLGSRRESTNSLFSRRPSGKVFTQFIHTCFFLVLLFLFIYWFWFLFPSSLGSCCCCFYFIVIYYLLVY
jgi:hypothetical protein